MTNQALHTFILIMITTTILTGCELDLGEPNTDETTLEAVISLDTYYVGVVTPSSVTQSQDGVTFTYNADRNSECVGSRGCVGTILYDVPLVDGCWMTGLDVDVTLDNIDDIQFQVLTKYENGRDAVRKSNSITNTPMDLLVDIHSSENPRVRYVPFQCTDPSIPCSFKVRGMESYHVCK